MGPCHCVTKLQLNLTRPDSERWQLSCTCLAREMQRTVGCYLSAAKKRTSKLCPLVTEDLRKPGCQGLLRLLAYHSAPIRLTTSPMHEALRNALTAHDAIRSPFETRLDLAFTSLRTRRRSECLVARALSTATPTFPARRLVTIVMTLEHDSRCGACADSN